MNGTGVGFSVERQDVIKLPNVADELHETDTTIVVPDSKLGWAKSLKELIHLLYSGQIPSWDLSKVRPAGAPLKTFWWQSIRSRTTRSTISFRYKYIQERHW